MLQCIQISCSYINRGQLFQNPVIDKITKIHVFIEINSFPRYPLPVKIVAIDSNVFPQKMYVQNLKLFQNPAI